MRNQFFAQHGEDRWLNEHLGISRQGFFIDVGAADGKTDSNTLFLEQRGWNGICIEPDSRHILKLHANRKCVVIHGAVTRHKKVPFYQHATIPTWSGFFRKSEIKTIVPLYTLDNIIKDYKVTKIDLLSIDTEGTEIDVWRTLTTLKPRIVIMEWNTEGLPSNKENIITEMKDYYPVHETLGNIIFVENNGQEKINLDS